MRQYGNSMDGEVVAFIYNGSQVDASPHRLLTERTRVTAWITRTEAQMMSACDLGTNWDNLVKCPTLVKVIAGELIFDETTVLKNNREK